MKKFLLPLIALLTLLCGCTKYYVTEEHYNVQGLDMTLVDFTVNEADWTYREAGGSHNEAFYEAILEVPQITKDVIERGLVLVYVQKTDDAGKLGWSPLPSLFTDFVELDDGTAYFTNCNDFECFQGRVNVFFTSSDLQTENPGTQVYRVAIQL